MTGERFGRREGGQLFPKNTLHCCHFAGVVVGRSGAVGIDVTDVGWGESGHLKCFRHSAVRALAIGRRCRLVEGVAGVGITAQLGKRGNSAVQSRGFGFEHDVGGAFAEIDACAVAVERAAAVAVKYHQGVEAVEVEACESLAPSGHHDVVHTRAYHIGA